MSTQTFLLSIAAICGILGGVLLGVGIMERGPAVAIIGGLLILLGVCAVREAHHATR